MGISEKIKECEDRVDALHKRVDKRFATRKDASSEQLAASQKKQAHEHLTGAGWRLSSGSEGEGKYTNRDHPDHVYHVGKSFSSNVAFSRQYKNSSQGGGVGASKLKVHLSTPYTDK